ncbi:hypothetical protein CB1_001095019 [Camelus ferus]|nr:hypothetical protein CB1_001095019 [Camelus ferus]
MGKSVHHILKMQHLDQSIFKVPPDFLIDFGLSLDRINLLSITAFSEQRMSVSTSLIVPYLLACLVLGIACLPIYGNLPFPRIQG